MGELKDQLSKINELEGKLHVYSMQTARTLAENKAYQTTRSAKPNAGLHLQPPTDRPER